MATRSLGSLTIDLIAKIAGFEQGMDKAARSAAKRSKEIADAAQKYGKIAGAALGAGIAAAATVAVSWTKDIVALGQELDRFSKIANTSTQEFQRWAAGAETAGISQEKLADQLKDFNEKLGEFQQTGGGGMKDFFEQIAPQIGITAEAFRNLSGPQALQLYYDSLEKANLSQQQMSFYLESMASDTTALIPLLRNGGEGFRKFGDEAERFGGILSKEMLDAIEETRVASARLDSVMLGLKVSVAQELLPAFNDFMDLLGDRKTQESMKSIAEFLGDAARAAVWFAQKIAEAGNKYREFLQSQGYLPAGQLDTEAQINERIRKLAQMQYGNDPVNTIRRGLFGDSIRQQLQEAVSELKGLPFRNVVGGASSLPADGGGGGGGGGGGAGRKSQAERDAERLDAAYQSLMETQRERIALFDAEGEAAKVAYELEHGALKALDDAKKQELLTEAQRYDALVKRREADEAAYRLAQEETRRIQEGLKYGKQLVSDLQFELELMRMTNSERATAIQLRGLEAEAVAEYGAAIAEANRKIEEEMENVRFMDGIRGEFSDFFTDAITGAESVTDAFKSMMDNIARMITQRIADRWVEQLFGSYGSSAGGSTGGWFSALMGMFGGGKAAGGWAQANTIYEVNERGLEMATVKGRDYLLTGNSPVHITPHHQLSGGGGAQITQNFINPRMTNIQTDSQRAREEARKAQRALARV